MALVDIKVNVISGEKFATKKKSVSARERKEVKITENGAANHPTDHFISLKNYAFRWKKTKDTQISK